VSTKKFEEEGTYNLDRIMIFIKPWDSTVFENFFVFLQTLNELQNDFNYFIDIVVSSELHAEYQKSTELR
jgi:hypothetical protein